MAWRTDPVHDMAMAGGTLHWQPRPVGARQRRRFD
jgi:hypothetical protein